MNQQARLACATETIGWQMSVGVGKPLRECATLRTLRVNIMLRVDKGFVICRRTREASARAAAWRGVRLARAAAAG